MNKTLNTKEHLGEVLHGILFRPQAQYDGDKELWDRFCHLYDKPEKTILTEPEKRVRLHLIKMLHDPERERDTITYTQLTEDYELGFNLQSNDDRLALWDMLDKISRYECENERPPLSAVVVRARPKAGVLHGVGFFDLCGELKMINDKTDKKLFSKEVIVRCQNFWRNEANYNAYK